jgi:hypothetical protein
MSRVWKSVRVPIVAVIGAGQFWLINTSAQTTASSIHAPVATNAASASLEPPLFAGPSPVDLFRELLHATTPEERNQLLAGRTPENRKRILAKVREYQSLKPSARELRLKATELRWYLLPLMSLPATNRTAQLEQVPLTNRKLVEVRLQHWDRLTPATQKELLENEATLRYFTELEGANAEQQHKLLQNLSPARRQKLEAGLVQWRAMPESDRRRMLGRFNQFFELTPAERNRALEAISDPERRQMEKTLRSYAALTPEQRAQCVRSFEKFADLSVEERLQFLKNAERWKLMSLEQRQAWRDLVNQVTLLPPEIDTPPMPQPPPPRPGPAVATNGL